MKAEKEQMIEIDDGLNLGEPFKKTRERRFEKITAIVSVPIRRQCLEHLDQAASRLGISRCEAIRQGIEMYLRQTNSNLDIALISDQPGIHE